MKKTNITEKKNSIKKNILRGAVALCLLGALGCGSEVGEEPATGKDNSIEIVDSTGNKNDYDETDDFDVITPGDNNQQGDIDESDDIEVPDDENSPSDTDAQVDYSTYTYDDILNDIMEVDYDLSNIPEYSGTDYVELNGNVPYFMTEADGYLYSYYEENISDDNEYEYYSDLDSLGRCQTAFAIVEKKLMPTGARESISSVKPTGWHYDKYDFVDQELLYNRSHLIAYSMAGENANEKNLVTGTRYFNAETMLPFEEAVVGYVKKTNNSVMYRVTPYFENDDLVCRGVLMEAYSIQDDGDGICYCVFVYNVQPGVEIDYATGDNWLENEEATTYVLNTYSMKYHLPECDGVQDMNPKNKEYYEGTRSELEKMGYKRCGYCIY